MVAVILLRHDGKGIGGGHQAVHRVPVESHHLIKARHFILRVGPEQAALLKEFQEEAARCWNDIVIHARDHYAATRTWVSKGDLQKRLKGGYRLHSQTIQALTDKFVSNRQTAANLRRQGVNVRYPWREKKFLTIPFKQMAIRTGEKGTLVLSLAAGVSFDTGFVPPASINTCEILWRRGRYILSWASDYPEAKPLAGIRAGADIGEIHPVAVCDEQGSGLVVSGREVRSIKRRRNKSLAWFSNALSRCKKGSRRWRKLIAAKGRMKSTSDSRVRDLLHKATRKAIDFCVTNNISELVIGNPAGVEKDTKKKRRLSRKSRQKVSQMEFGTIKRYLRYKAHEAGIASCLTDEEGTSSDCPACGCKNHPTGRTYLCGQCGFTAHRDGKAGFMMLRKRHFDIALPDGFVFSHVQSIPKYRKRVLPACVDGPDVAPSSLAIA